MTGDQEPPGRERPGATPDTGPIQKSADTTTDKPIICHAGVAEWFRRRRASERLTPLCRCGPDPWLCRCRRPYQLGDHDPSGVAAWDDIQRKLRDFVDDDIDVTFERIAVTPEQITELDLPTRPTKQSDTRARTFVGESVEVDAIASSVLRDLIRSAIEQWIDRHELRMTRIAEHSERQILARIADSWWWNPSAVT